MSNSNSAVIGGFTPVQLAKHVPQRLTLEVSAFAVAKAQCLMDRIEDEETLRQVYAAVKEKFDKYALSPAQIKQRQLIFFPKLTDLSFGENGGFDIADPKPEEAHLRVYDIKHDPHGADIKSRHESYAKVVTQSLERMFEGVEAPNDLIHVTCTGFMAPNPVERIVSQWGWRDTTVSNCYHKGCYASLPAIKMAHGLLALSQLGFTTPKQRVDVVHTELFSVHSNLLEPRADNIIAMTLFADGLMKYSVYTEDEARRQGIHGFKILTMDEKVLPDSAEAMTGIPGPYQLNMGLSPIVPVVIKRHVKAFTVELLARAGMDYEQDKPKLNFVVHPGGPKIVEHVQSELELNEEQVAISKRVFHENGNMSSATIPYILMDTLEHVAVGSRVVCLGFGPGLTIAGLVLEKI